MFKMAAGSVLASGSLRKAEMAAGSVMASEMAAESLRTADMAHGTQTTAEMASRMTAEMHVLQQTKNTRTCVLFQNQDTTEAFLRNAGLIYSKF